MFAGQSPAPRRVLADHVYSELITSLVDGRLVPGAPLNMDALSREFAISQTPIREALARLEATGLVVRTALKGYRVADLLTAKEIVDLFDARLAIEPVTAELAAVSATAEVDARLTDINDELERLKGSRTNAARYREADERFHTLIATTADNRFLLQAFSALGGQVQRFRLFGGSGITDAADAVTEHRALIAAISARDPDLARMEMTRHLEAVRVRALGDRDTIDARS